MAVIRVALVQALVQAPVQALVASLARTCVPRLVLGALAGVVAVALPMACSAGAARTPSSVDVLDDACPADPTSVVTSEPGEVPFVVVSTHAGSARPEGCDPGADDLRPLAERSCDASLDSCVSGPCRAGGPDGHARALTFAIVDELTRCLGGRPALVVAEIERSIVDMNRDAHDPVGMRCALDDPGALAYWDAFHRAVEERVAAAVDQGGSHAFLIDVHAYASLPAAPPPAIMLGTGEPFGLTLPHLADDDPSLSAFFGPDGLRERLLTGLASYAGMDVHPASLDSSLDGLFKGRYIVHRYARRVGSEVDDAGPAIDSLQIETSSQVRDNATGTGAAIARALCGALGTRIASAP